MVSAFIYISLFRVCHLCNLKCAYTLVSLNYIARYDLNFTQVLTLEGQPLECSMNLLLTYIVGCTLYSSSPVQAVQLVQGQIGGQFGRG